MQTQSKDRKGSNSSAVVKGNIITTPQRPQFAGPIQNNKGFRPSSRFQSINRGRR